MTAVIQLPLIKKQVSEMGLASPAPDLSDYDHIIVFFSGGKDSLACYLYLLDLGYPAEQIELWHHDIDGQGERYMDWPCTEAYCAAVASWFGSPYFRSWKEGGFLREMMRDNEPTAAVHFETPDGLQTAGGKSKRVGTRKKFPQVSGNLMVRWCSAYLKIDPARMAIRNDERFRYSKTLVISGERAEESSNRAKYKVFEVDSADGRHTQYERHVDRWRPALGWPEYRVWEIIEQYKVNPHPAYHLGWGRVSCQFCIFGNRNQWASARVVDPDGFARIAADEEASGLTIQRDRSVVQLADEGEPYESINPDMVQIAMSSEYNQPVIVDDWQLPAGAFGESCGPI